LNQRPTDESQQGLFGERTTLSESSQKIFDEIRDKLLVDDPEAVKLAKARSRSSTSGAPGRPGYAR
jgi:hypothetical protein